MSNNPFFPPAVPRSALELLRWVIFELPHLEKFWQALSKKQALRWLLRSYIWAVSLGLILYLVASALNVGLELPLRFPSFKPSKSDQEILAIFQQTPDFFERYWGFIHIPKHLHGLVGLIVITLIFIVFMFTIDWRLLADLLFIALSLLLFCPVLGMNGGAVGHLIAGPMFGMVAGLYIGVKNRKIGKPSFDDITFYLALALLMGSSIGLAASLVMALGVCLGGCLGYFRLIFYPGHFVASLIRLDFHHNPYLHDHLRLPIWGATRRLTHLAPQDPATASQFIEFLLQYRPLQHDLAQHLLHALAADQWRQHPLAPDIFNPPQRVENQSKWYPSSAWLNALDATKNQLANALAQDNAALQNQAWQPLIDELRGLYEQTLRESPRWNHYYLPALAVWLDAAEVKLNTTVAENTFS